MRILWVSATAPWPPDHGTRNRAWHLLCELARTDDVEVMVWQTPDDHPDALTRVADVAGVVVTEPITAASTRLPTRVARQLAALTGGHPPFVAQWRAERGLPARGGRPHDAAGGVWDEVRERHARLPYDVVVADFDAGALVSPDLGIPFVAHRHQVFSELLGSLRVGSWLGRRVWALERRGWTRFDRAALGDVNVATTELSAARLAEVAPDARIVVVPNGVDLPEHVYDPTDGVDLAIVGSMDYAPNAQGARWFVEHVFGRVRAAAPQARLRIIGRHGEQALGDLSGEGVDIVGYVEDLARALRGCRVGVVPLLGGLGIKTKTLEFCALGLPVVATTAGVEGLDAARAAHAVCDEPEAMAVAVLELIADAGVAHAAGRAGRSVAAEHSWARAGALHREAIASVVGAGSAPRSTSGEPDRSPR